MGETWPALVLQVVLSCVAGCLAVKHLVSYYMLKTIQLVCYHIGRYCLAN